MTALGLIAGNGALPSLVARAARAQGERVVAVGHVGETAPELEGEVDAFHWVRIGQVNRIQKLLREAGVQRAVMAGGIGRLKALREARPDLGSLRILSKVKSVRDDALLRAIAADFEAQGIALLSIAAVAPQLLVPEGHLAGPALEDTVRRDIEVGLEVASLLGKADVGQTVVVKGGLVLAVEAIEGTDEAIRRGAALGGKGVVVVKRCKPGQDERLDLPTVGPRTLQVMRASGARALAVEAGKTLLLEGEAVLREAEAAGISLVGVRPPAP
jgi:DUF1009 family protein